MSPRTTIHFATAAVIAAGIAAPLAAATGEPKNMPPFTRPTVSQSQPASRATAAATESAPPAGEPKNEPPFTRPVATATDLRATSNFKWTDAALGALTAVGVMFAAAGGLIAVRATRRPRARTAV